MLGRPPPHGATHRTTSSTIWVASTSEDNAATFHHHGGHTAIAELPQHIPGEVEPAHDHGAIFEFIGEEMRLEWGKSWSLIAIKLLHDKRIPSLIKKWT